VEPAGLIRPVLTALVPWHITRKDDTMKFSPRDIWTGKVLAVAVLGAAGFAGVAACGTAAVQPRASAAPVDNNSVARYIARIAIGNGGLAALNDGDGQATLAICDPSTVSKRPEAGSPMSASCGINYADGSVWKQTVTVIVDRHGDPVADSTSLGTEILQPTGG
jgi:hypothetical protein